MANYYVNFSVRTERFDEVVDWLRARSRIAYVARPNNGWIVVFDRDAESAQAVEIESLGAGLASLVDDLVIAVRNIGDTMLSIWAIGRDPAISCYESSQPASAIEFANCLGAALRGLDLPRLGQVLRGNNDVFECHRHQRFAKVTGIPESAVATGYSYIADGELPFCLDESDLVRVNG